MSNTGWSPRPRRPMGLNGGLVTYPDLEQANVVVKGLSPMQRQRQEDGTPVTRAGHTSLRPADPALYLKGHEPVSKAVSQEDANKKTMERLDKAYSIVKSFVGF